MRFGTARNGILRGLDFHKNGNLLDDFILRLQKPQKLFRGGMAIPTLQVKRWRLREINVHPGEVVWVEN